jgi:hypothetical protein
MMARLLVFLLAIIVQFAFAGDQRSDLKLTAAHRMEGHPAWFIISAAAHKRVLVAIKGAKISSLDVSAEFPYSVRLTDSPTSRYTAVLLFEDRRKDLVIDSFGITASDDLVSTDAETHQKFVDSAALGRALGENLGKEIRGENH